MYKMNHYLKYKKYKQKYKKMIAGSQTPYLTRSLIPQVPQVPSQHHNLHTTFNGHQDGTNHDHDHNLYQKDLARDHEPLFNRLKHRVNNYWDTKHYFIDDRPAHSSYPTSSDEVRGLDTFEDSSHYSRDVKQILPIPPGTSKHARNKRKKLQNKIQHAFDLGEPLSDSEHQQHLEYADSSHWIPERLHKNSYTQWKRPASSCLTPKQRGLEY